jgi:putative glycosyltransferase
MDVSVVTTIYQSSAFIQDFYKRVLAELTKFTQDFEIIFVIDGSQDDSLDQILSLQKSDTRVIAIDLSRNFGHHAALMEGLSKSSGNLVFLIDSDLEEEPEWFSLFHKTLTETNSDMVYGVQKSRKGKIFEKLSGRLFYFTFNLLSSAKIRPNPTTARLMTRKYTESLLQHHEKELYIYGLFQITGFKQKELFVSKKSKGSTTYSLMKRIDLLVNAITSFSVKPLLAIFYTGLFIFFGASIGIVILLYKKFVIGVPIEGWSSLMASIWFLGGLIILFLGSIGIYLSKIFIEVKSRPRAISRNIYQVK